ncbi:Sister chromatid cohesion protein DCC1 [Geodia barretti]|uniref:Sister chromatid cohesion protein DCC1 n=1 Tax=Geodia barretti TaxID=519541 RepID=A0AA35R073_GEOBA|nr:Sister chromatid cohesion protein DCC1 [Geodia barretti]
MEGEGVWGQQMEQTEPLVDEANRADTPQLKEGAEAGERKRSEVVAAARAAGLCVEEGAPGTQLLRFAHGLNSDELRLMELPHGVLGALKEGERVVIRGEQGENAVLCTEGATYELRTADTSNALLLVPSLSYSQDNSLGEDPLPTKGVTMCLSNYLELRPCRPRTEKLRQLLSECPYRGPEYEEEGEEEGEEGLVNEGEESGEDDKDDWEERRRTKSRKVKIDRPRKYMFSELVEVVQASERELREALQKLQACLISGYWRLLEADYVEQAVQHILALLEEKDWPWTRVPLSSTSHHLQELLPRFVIKHCLDCYGTKISREDNSEADTYYELSVEKVCQFYAVLLLRQAGKFNYSEFMESWQQSVPLGMETDLGQLRRLALRDMSAMPPVIWYFPLSTLPQEPADRFNCLFSARQRWTQNDIEPYIDDLATPTQSLSALLLKYARVSTVKGVKMYNAKRTFK